MKPRPMTWESWLYQTILDRVGHCWVLTSPVLLVLPLGILMALAMAGCAGNSASTASAPNSPRPSGPLPTIQSSPTHVPAPPSPCATMNQATATFSARPTTDKITEYTIQLQSGHFTPPDDVAIGLEWLRTISYSPAHVLLQLYAPPDETTKDMLGSLGIRLLDYIPNNAWFASVPRNLHIPDVAVSVIRWLGPILPQDRMSRDLWEGEIGDWALLERDRVALEISFFKDVRLQDGEQLVCKYNGVVINSTDLSNKLQVEMPRGAIPFLATEDIVRWIDTPPPPPTIHSGGE